MWCLYICQNGCNKRGALDTEFVETIFSYTDSVGLSQSKRLKVENNLFGWEEIKYIRLWKHTQCLLAGYKCAWFAQGVVETTKKAVQALSFKVRLCN